MHKAFLIEMRSSRELVVTRATRSRTCALRAWARLPRLRSTWLSANCQAYLADLGSCLAEHDRVPQSSSLSVSRTIPDQSVLLKPRCKLLFPLTPHTGTSRSWPDCYMESFMSLVVACTCYTAGPNQEISKMTSPEKQRNGSLTVLY